MVMALTIYKWVIVGLVICLLIINKSKSIHANKDTENGDTVSNQLSFEEEPNDSFIVRTKPTILRCKTLNALKAWFSCNTGDERSIQRKLNDENNYHNYVDPQTGIRIIELNLEVTRTDIDDHTKAGYTTPYQCWCTAYGGHQQLLSRRASISFSYLRKHFINEPLSQSVAINAQTSFTCLPPEGDPKPTLFWLKNGEIINADNHGTAQHNNNKNSNDDDDHSDSDIIPHNLSADHDNYFIAHDGSLIIKEATLSDQANYTCAVRNPAGVRYSEFATLTVFVNGEWSSWGSWSSCTVANKCGRGSQKRVRYCSNPSPLNNGQTCVGESTQISDCSVICSPIDGSWTSWSSWSTCSHECSQVRQRVCKNPAPKHGGQHCMGHDFLIKNCSGGMCRKLDLYQLQRREREENGTSADNEQQIYLMSIIIITTFLFICVIFIFVILRRRRYKNEGWNDADEDRGTEDGQAMVLLLQQQQQQQQQSQQQPDLIRSGTCEKCQLISRLNNCNTNLLDHFVVRCATDPMLPNVHNHSINSCHNSDILSHNNCNNNQMSFNQLSSSSTSGTPKLLPASVLSMSATTNTSTTTATITSSEDDNNDSEHYYADSEHDYAEPILINKTPSPLPLPQPPSQPPPLPKLPSNTTTPKLLPRNTSVNNHNSHVHVGYYELSSIPKLDHKEHNVHAFYSAYT